MALASFLEKLGIKKGGSFFKEENRFLGVDIGASSIKVVQLKKERERAVLETYGELSLARYGDGEVGKSMRLVDTKLAEALKDIIKEAQVKATRAIVSISLKNSFLTTMDMPVLSDEDMKEAVPYEARKYIPIPLSEVSLDWWVLPPRSQEMGAASLGSGKRKFQTVILVAVPNEAISKLKNIFKSAGIDIVGFEIEVFSFARSVLRHDLGTVLLMDIGASSVKMMIADGGVVRASHSIDHGSQELTLALAQSLSIDWDRAEVLKRDNGIVKKPETEGVAKVLEPLVEIWSSEGQRFLLDWKRKGGKDISRVVIGGGGAELRGVADLLVKEYGVEVLLANPFAKVVYPAFLEPALKEVGSTFVNAVGLALREF